ncbi:hypothetical protein J4Q44_G00227760 [Coregonus suidteri]|uniref:Uncharacterized protein n=1 Tax=Coregonus suidteri TaxID=861788 RepID=A0AAN8LCV0_9TELE
MPYWCQWQESLVRQVSPAQKAPLAQLALQGKVLWDSPDPRALPDHPDLLATPHLANMAPQVGPVSLVSLAQLARKERRAQLDFKVPGACLDLLEAPDLLGSLPLATLDLTVCPEQWGQEGKQVLRDIQVCLVCQELRGIEEWVSQGHKVRQGLWDLWDQLGSLEHPELESQASQESLVRQEIQVAQVGMGPLVLWDCQVLRATLGLLV